MTLETILHNPSVLPKLVLTTTGLERLKEVSEVLERQRSKAPEFINQIEVQLLEKLSYLNQYGGDNYRVRLQGDPFAPLSFSVVWEKRQPNGEFVFAFNGGLQCDAVPQPFGSVNISMDDNAHWSIHT